MSVPSGGRMGRLNPPTLPRTGWLTPTLMLPDGVTLSWEIASGLSATLARMYRRSSPMLTHTGEVVSSRMIRPCSRQKSWSRPRISSMVSSGRSATGRVSPVSGSAAWVGGSMAASIRCQSSEEEGLLASSLTALVGPRMAGDWREAQSPTPAMPATNSRQAAARAIRCSRTPCLGGAASSPVSCSTRDSSSSSRMDTLGLVIRHRPFHASGFPAGDPLPAQEADELGPQAADPGVRRALRDAQLPGDFRPRVFVHVFQREQPPLRRA